MATRTAVLKVNIVSDAKGAKKGLEDTGTALDKFGGKLDKLAVPAAIAVGAVAALIKSTSEAASQLQQSTGAVESVYKEYADSVIKNSERASEAVGLSMSDYRQLAAVLGSQLKNMGIPLDKTADKTDELITLGADLAATFGGSTADAIAAVSSLLRGERDPIERYGVSIKQVDINAKKAAMGLDGLTGEAAKSADLQATLALLYEQTADAAGQFGRETDTMAGAQQIANAKWEDAKAALGEAFLPYLTDAAGAAADLATWVADNSDKLAPFAAIVGIAGAAVLILGGALKVAAFFQGVFNGLATMNPYVILIGAALLYAAQLYVMTFHTGEFTKANEGAWDMLRDFAAQLDKKFNTTWISELTDAFINLHRWIRDTLYFWIDFQQSARRMGTPSRMSLTAASTADAAVSTFNAPSSAAFESQGAIFAPSSGGGMSALGGPSIAPTVINLTVKGAIDQNGTARTIIDALNSYLRANGGIAAAGVSWQ